MHANSTDEKAMPRPMASAKSRAILCILSIAVVSLNACTHTSSENRATDRAPAQTIGTPTAESEVGIVAARNEERLNQLLLATRIAQTLVSSFDLRAQKINGEAEQNRLLGSRLYCKLQTARGLYEQVEDKLQVTFQEAFAASRADQEWLFLKLNTFAARDIASGVAVAHLLRRMSAAGKEICQTEMCVKDVAAAVVKFSFEVFNDLSFAKYVRSNQATIASYSDVSVTDLEPGDCFNGAQRAPNQAATYDWKGRNWVAGNLKPGEFVVTYDDGPHASFTQPLLSLWMDSGYPKPAFFWLAKNIGPLADTVLFASQKGFPVALHSERHADLGNLAKASDATSFNRVNAKVFGSEVASLPPGQFENWKGKTLDREIVKAAEALQTLVRRTDPGYRVKYFRLPFGSGLRNEAIGARLAKIDADHYYWAVDSLDWQDSNPESVHQRVVEQMRSAKRGIILFHDVQAPTARATKLLLETFRSNPQWRPVSIHEVSK